MPTHELSVANLNVVIEVRGSEGYLHGIYDTQSEAENKIKALIKLEEEPYNFDDTKKGNLEWISKTSFKKYLIKKSSLYINSLDAFEHKLNAKKILI